MLNPKKSVRNIQAYEVPLFEESWDVKIDSNENLFGPSPKVIEAIRNIEPKDILFYPLYGEICEKIAQYCGFSIDNIKVTNGADEAIYSIFQTYLDTDDIVLTVKPSFAMPVIYSKVLGAKLVEVPYIEKWKFPILEFLAKISNPKVKIVHVTTPNNPTGEMISESDLVQIIEAAKDKVIVIDETYGNYCNSAFKKFVHEYENVFIVKSFSKDFALAGLRLGYIITNSVNIRTLKLVVSPFNVNSVAVKAGIAALDDLEYFEKIKEEIETSKLLLKECFESLGAVVYPSNANFLCVDFSTKVDFIMNSLISNGIIVKKFATPELDGILRVTAPPVSIAKKVIDTLKIKDTIIFDMDGVLIDASNSYRLAIKKTYEFFANKELETSRIQDAKNRGGLNNDWMLTDFLLKQDSINIPYDKIIEKFQEFYWDNGNGLINNENLLINKDLLKKLSEKFNLSIFTGRPKKEALFALEKYKIKEIFFPIITMDDLPENKQKPDIAGVELIKSKILSNKTYYLGDTVDDMICANNADIVPVGILPPNENNVEISENLKANGAKFILNNVSDLKNLLENIYEMQF